MRDQTTEERIAQIAEGFNQGIGNFQSGQKTQRDASLQAEATRRQQAMQAFEVENKIMEQTGQMVKPGTGAQWLNDPSSVDLDGAITGEPTHKAKIAADAAQKTGEWRDSQINKNNRSGTSGQKENLTYQQKLDMKAQHDLESEKLKKPSSDQRKVATFVQRIDQAEKDFISLEGKGFNRGSNEAGAESLLPNALKGENIKLQDQAERNFVNSVLRRESGAAIAPSEFESAELQYFPRMGDTQTVIAQKRKNREIVMAGLKAEAGDRAMGEIGQKMQESAAAPGFSGQGSSGSWGINEAHAGDNIEKIKSAPRQSKLDFLRSNP